MSYIGVMACSSRFGVIGLGGKIPWHYPKELEHYRKVTEGKPLIMGYYTYFSMPEHALKNRINIVFSRIHRREKSNSPARFVSSWEAFIELKLSSGCMIGGGEISRLFFEKNALRSLYLTRIHREYKGDVFFPLEKIADWPYKIVLKTKDYTIYLYENPSYTNPSHSDR